MSLFDADKSAARTPVALVTGFLGSGKTTLLNRLLAHPGMAQSLVLVNEFGEIALDHLLIESVSGDMVLMRSGCVCCTVKGDLERTLREVAARRQRDAMPPFDRVLIETTGLADPAPVAQLLLNWPTVSHDYRLDALVCTVDAVHGERQLDEHEEAVKQAALADRILLTKCDLAPQRAALGERLAALNPGAPLFEVTNGDIDPARLFGAGPFDPLGRSDQARAWLSPPATRLFSGRIAPSGAHDRRIASGAWRLEEPLDWERFNAWLTALRQAHAERLLRVKGLLNVAGEDGPLVVHGMHAVFHPPTRLARWPDCERRSRLVLIVRDLPLEEIDESLRAAGFAARRTGAT